MIGCVQSRLSTSSPRLVPDVESPDRRCGQLLLDAGHVVVEDVVVEQVALLGATARVADHPGRSTGQRDRPVAGVLEAAQRDQPDQVADVQAVGRRIAPVVDRDRTVGDLGPQELAIGRVVDEVARLEIGDQVHTTAEGTLAGGRPVGRFASSRRRFRESGSDHLADGRRCTPRCPSASPIDADLGSGCSGTRRPSNSCRCCCSPAPTTCCSTSPTASSPSGTRTSRPTTARPTIRR